ncbi:hypothetical protein [Streptomyces lydicus]
MDHDRTWLSELRAALGCSGELFALMLLVDLAWCCATPSADGSYWIRRC